MCKLIDAQVIPKWYKMIVVINCIAVIHGKVFLSKSAADLHRDDCKISLFLLPFLKLPVHGTALNKKTLGSSSQLIILNNPAIKNSDNLHSVKNKQQYTPKWLINHLVVNLHRHCQWSIVSLVYGPVALHTSFYGPGKVIKFAPPSISVELKYMGISN